MTDLQNVKIRKRGLSKTVLLAVLFHDAKKMVVLKRSSVKALSVTVLMKMVMRYMEPR